MSPSVGCNGLWNGHLKGLFLVEISGGSRCSGKGGGGGGGGGKPTPGYGWPGRPKIFSALRASVWSQNKGEGPELLP